MAGRKINPWVKIALELGPVAEPLLTVELWTVTVDPPATRMPVG